MSAGRPVLFRLFAFCLLLSGLALPALAGQFDAARAALAEQAYEKAEKLLEQELGKAQPAAEALEIGVEAALGAGRIKTAQKRVTSLLQARGTTDASLVLRAARIARQAGDEEKAQQRYRLYLEQNPPQSPELKAALTSYLDISASPEAYRRLVETFGATPEAWLLGSDLLERLFRRRESKPALSLTGYLLQQFPRAEVANQVHATVARAARNAQTGRAVAERYAEPLRVLVKSKPTTVEHMVYLFENGQRAMEPADRTKAALAIQNLSPTPLSAAVFSAFEDMKELKTAPDRHGAGQAYLGLEKLYAGSEDRADYARYLRVIATSPEVFRIANQTLVSGDAMQTKLQTLLGKPGAEAADQADIIAAVAENYVTDPASRVAFLKKFAAGCRADQRPLQMLLQDLPDGEYKAFVQAYAQRHGTQDVLDLKASQLGRYNALQDKAGLLSAAGEYMQAYPGTFDVKRIDQHVLQSKLLSTAEKLGLVKTVLTKAGLSNPLSGLVGKLSAFKNAPQYDEIMALYKAEKEGSDPVMAAHARIGSISRDPRNPSKKVYQIAEAFLKSYQGKVPGDRDDTGSLPEVTARSVFNQHLAHVQRNPGEVFRCAKLWAGRLGTGQDYVDLVRQVRAFRGTEVLHEMAPQLLQQVQAGAAPTAAVWAEISYAQTPRGEEGRSLFAGVYPQMGARHALRYVQMNKDRWDNQLYLFELKKVAALDDFLQVPWGGDFGVRRAIDDARRQARGKATAPPELTERLWVYYSRRRLDRGLFDQGAEADLFEQHKRAGRSDAAQKMMTKLMESVAARSPLEQIQALVGMVRFMDEEEPVGTLKPGFRAHTLVKELKPRLEKLPASAHRLVRFPAEVRDGLERYVVAAADGPEKQAAEALRRLIGRYVIDGASFSDAGAFLPYVRLAAEERIAAGEWQNVAEMAIRLPEVLQRNNDWSWNFSNVVQPLARQLSEAGAHEMAYVLLTNIEKSVQLPGRIKNQVAMEITQAASQMGGVLIGEGQADNPLGQLRLAADFYQRKNTSKAWELSRGRLSAFEQNWLELDQEYVAWVIDRVRKTGGAEDLDRARQLCRTVLAKADDLRPETAGQIFLTMGDIERDKQNFQAARIEYERLKENPRYQETEAGKQSKFRLIELLVRTGSYDSAELEVERLLDSPNPDTRAEAFYLLALLRFKQEAYEEARDYISKVRTLNMYHPEAVLLEGEIRLQMNDLGETELELAPPELANTLTPGKELVLKLRDPNLGIVKGGAFIPVQVYTSTGKDREILKLFASPNDATLFRGSLRTGLGEATPENHKLEVIGKDTVLYMIEEDYQKRNGLNFPAKSLAVKANGALAASSGEILTEEEQQERERQERLRRLSGREEEEGPGSRRTALRDLSTIRPGGPIYLQVIDRDMDLGPEKDSVLVKLETSSGDVLEGFALTETEPHSAIFRGEAPTGIPLPKAWASDTREGTAGPSVIINRTAEGAWTSVQDGKKPKSVAVDTMTSVEVKRVAIAVENPQSIRKLSLDGVLLGNEFETLTAWPAEERDVTGGLTLTLGRGEPENTSVGGLRNFLRANTESRTQQKMTTFRRSLTPLRARGWVVGSLKGLFYLPEDRTLELKFLQRPSPGDMQTAYVVVDGRSVLGGTLDEQAVQRTRRLPLSAGVHRFEMVFRDYPAESDIAVGYLQDDGTYAPLPPAWFDAQAHPALAEALQPAASISQEGDRFVADFQTPMRLRRLRWSFLDFAGEGVVAREFSIVSADGETVVPAESDFSTAKTNNTLEVAPGDEIVVTYEDKKTLRDAEPVLRQELNASYYNGEISILSEVFAGKDRDGNPQRSYFPTRRCRPGDTVQIHITDWDYDLTDQRDTVDLSVTTSGGETLQLKALETAERAFRGEAHHEHAGTFRQTLNIGETTNPQQNTIALKEGEIVTVSFLDRENTDPGIPIERAASMEEAGTSDPAFTVYTTFVRMVPDTSEVAKQKLERLKRSGAGDEEDAVILKKQIVAAHPSYAEAEVPVGAGARASVDAPLLFEVRHPQEARHAGSSISAWAVAASELAAAEAAGREPAWAEVPLYVDGINAVAGAKGYEVQVQTRARRAAEGMLDAGAFAGVVRLQLGSPGDPVDDLVVQDELPAFGEERRTVRDDTRVPTIVVAGSDTVHIEYRGPDGGEPVAKQNVELVSDARLELLDSSYAVQNDSIFLGERFYVRLTDLDRDVSAERDHVTLKVRSEAAGEEITLTLGETLPHSGIFTANLQPQLQDAAGGPAAAPAANRGGATPAPAEGEDAPEAGEALAGEAGAEAAERPATGPSRPLAVEFGDRVHFEYTDETSLSSLEPRSVRMVGTIHLGNDGQVAAFSKVFKDPEMAVKTRFLMAEALFEMAKDLRGLERQEESDDAIVRGKRILEEALRDYPDTSLAAQGEFLLANLAEENKNYDEAIGRFSEVLNRWPESEYAARSQFHKGICFEKKDEFDQAAEEYVKLTYLYPDSPLVQDATVRLGNYYYKMKRYDVAAKIFSQFQKRFSTHRLAGKALFLAAQCYMKNESFERSAETLEQLIEEYKEDKALRAEAMYWLGESYYKRRDMAQAAQTFMKLTWEYPESKWAKIARGRLTEEALSKALAE